MRQQVPYLIPLKFNGVVIPWFSTFYIHLYNGKPWSCIPQLKNLVDNFPFRFPTHWPKSAAVEPPKKGHRRDALKVGKSISWEAAMRDISEIAPGWFPETKTHVASWGWFQKRWPSKCSGCPFLGDMWIECWLLIVFGVVSSPFVIRKMTANTTRIALVLGKVFYFIGIIMCFMCAIPAVNSKLHSLVFYKYVQQVGNSSAQLGIARKVKFRLLQWTKQK